jgi:CheY-like chemotaxis protein
MVLWLLATQRGEEGMLKADFGRRKPGTEVSALRSLEPLWALAPSQAVLTHVSVLVIDDNRDSGHLLKTFLEYCGASVRVSTSAPAALHVLRSFSPHVILCDIAMPGHDGLWLIHQLRGNPRRPCSRIPVVAITAYGEEFGAERARAHGFDAYLQKPVHLDALTNLICRLASPKAA